MLTSLRGIRRSSPSPRAQDSNQPARHILFESEFAQVADRLLDVIGGPLQGYLAIFNDGIAGSRVAVPRWPTLPGFTTTRSPTRRIMGRWA